MADVETRLANGWPVYGICGEQIQGIDMTGIPVERCPLCVDIFEQHTGLSADVIDPGATN